MTDTTAINALRYSEQSDAPNANTGFQNLAEDVDRRLVAIFATTAARDAAIPSPTNGMVCYVTSTSAGANNRALNVYDGSTWVPYYKSMSVRKPSAQTVTSSVSLINDLDLVLAVEANTVYFVTGMFILSGNDTEDFQFQFTYPTSATLAGGIISLLDTTTPGVGTAGDGNFRALAAQVTPSTALAMGMADTNLVMGTYHGSLYVQSTAGNLQLKWAQGTSGGTGTTVNAGSVLRIERIS